MTAVVIKGLAEHKDELGAPLCPCRHYDDKAAEAEMGFWNCPCVPMRERKVRVVTRTETWAANAPVDLPCLVCTSVGVHPCFHHARRAQLADFMGVVPRCRSATACCF